MKKTWTNPAVENIGIEETATWNSFNTSWKYCSTPMYGGKWGYYNKGWCGKGWYCPPKTIDPPAES